MCKRSKPDPLAEVFLRRYRMNLLSLPGNRVRCGSVYVKQGGSLTAPGDLADLVEPELQLPPPYMEPNLPELRGTRSDRVAAQLGFGLLESFLAALGAPGLLDKLRAGAERQRVRGVSFRFRDAARESLSPTALAAALEGHRFQTANAWIKDGNRYYVAAAVVRSPSISIRAHDEAANAVDLGAEVATLASAETAVSVERSQDNELTYRGGEPIGFAVELYELMWDAESSSLAFATPSGPLPVVGFDDGERPESVFVGEDDEAIAKVD